MVYDEKEAIVNNEEGRPDVLIIMRQGRESEATEAVFCL